MSTQPELSEQQQHFDKWSIQSWRGSCLRRVIIMQNNLLMMWKDGQLRWDGLERHFPALIEDAQELLDCVKRHDRPQTKVVIEHGFRKEVATEGHTEFVNKMEAFLVSNMNRYAKERALYKQAADDGDITVRPATQQPDAPSISARQGITVTEEAGANGTQSFGSIYNQG